MTQTLDVADAFVAQENGPERVDATQQQWARVAASAPRAALLLSSSSAIAALRQGAGLEDSPRLLVGHPFDPPHVIPPVAGLSLHDLDSLEEA